MSSDKHPAGWRRWLIEIEVAIIGTIMITGTVTALFLWKRLLCKCSRIENRRLIVNIYAFMALIF